MDPKRLEHPGMMDRISTVLQSGIDPRAYYVSATTLRKVVRETDANADLKRKLLGFLDRKVIKQKPLVNCIALGRALAEFASKTDDEDFLKITDNVRDLNKLPYVIANGRTVS